MKQIILVTKTFGIAILFVGCSQTTQTSEPTSNVSASTVASTTATAAPATATQEEPKATPASDIDVDEAAFIIDEATGAAPVPSAEPQQTDTREYQKWQLDQFKNSDTNRDGFVSMPELVVFHQKQNERSGGGENPEMTANWWMKLKDLDQDGKLTLSEFHYWKKKAQ